MSELAACRVCLAHNVRFHAIRNTRLQILYENLTNYKLIEDGRPEMVCYMCRAQLQKCQRLADKSEKSEDILTELSQNNIQISQETMAILNKELKHWLQRTPIETVNYTSEISVKEENFKEELEDVDMEAADHNGVVVKNAVMCRVCLTGTARVQYVKNTQLQAIYETITNNKMNKDGMVPHAVCCMCRVLLQHCRKLVKKANRTEQIITELLRNGVEMTQSTITMLNRKVKSHLSTSVVEYSTYSPVTNTDPHLLGENIVNTKENENSKGAIEKRVKETEQIVETTKQRVKFNKKTIGNELREKENEQSLQPNIQVEDIEPRIELSKYILDNNAQIKKPNVQTVKQTKLIAKLNGRVGTSAEIAIEHEHLVKEEVVVKQEPVEIENVTFEDNAIESSPGAEDTKINIKIEDIDIKPSILQYNETYKLIKNIIGNNYYCSVCNYECNNKKRLERHENLHDLNRAYPCTVCSYRYRTSSNLINHLRYVHSYNYTCKICNKQFSGQLKFKRHTLIHSRDTIYTCDICNLIYTNRTSLRDHRSLFHPSARYPCAYCPITFSSQRWLNDHVFKRHAGQTPFCICDICQKSFAKKKTLKVHLITHAAAKPFYCEICSKSFNQVQSYEIHARIHTGEKPYVCGICNKGFRDKQNLKRHILEVHTADKVYSCNTCAMTFTRKSVLKSHMYTHSGQKIFSCRRCKLKFLTRSYVKKHMLLHSEDRPYTCELCHKKFKRTTDLKHHMSVHYGVKSFACDTCDKKFKRRQYLWCHMQFHKGVKLFNCTTCGKSFYTKVQLMTHIRVHTGEKPYACHLCDRSFSQKNSLIRHVNTHSSAKPFKCDRCDRKFADRNALRYHKVIAHTSPTQFICDYCNKVYAERKRFIRHVRSHNGMISYKCDRCGSSFPKLTFLAQHVKVHKRLKIWACRFCDKKFKLQSSLSTHRVCKHAGIKLFACNICEMDFNHLNRLDNHMRSHTGDKPFPCHLCVKQYVERRDLLQHMKMTHNFLK